MTARLILIILSVIAFLPPLRASTADYVWVEGESAKTQNAVRHGWYNSVKRGMLSGGDWLCNFGNTEAIAEYDVEIPKNARYAFWIRANPVAGARLSYQFNGGEWVAIDLQKNQQENTNIALDDKPDMRFVAWIKVGDLDLKQGKASVRFKMHSANKNHGGLDCFVFSAVPFTPNGICKPGQKLGLANEGRWAFEPDADPFDKTALLDLRGLNEKVAGESGYIAAGSDGDFRDGKGDPIRFWCVNTTVQAREGVDDLRVHARFLAKRGVNMVRHHGHINPGENQKITDVDSRNIDELQKLVAVMKEEGIYTTFSPFWATSKGGAGWGIPGHGGGPLFTLLFWDPTLQNAYKGWLREALGKPNPYDKDKTPLAKDPALAIFQIQNEDSFLFWTTQGVIKDEKLKRLQAVYDAWREEKGKPPAALNFRFWELNQPNQDHKDTMRFFAESMFKWNKEIERYLRDDLGCKALVNAGNWRTANQTRLLDLERYSYAANEIIGVNRYVNGSGSAGCHVSPGPGPDTSGYLVKAGDFFQDVSALVDPLRLPTNAKQVAGMPYIISESCWVPPMSHQSESPFLIAAYSSLNGIDGYYWFALGANGFDRTLNKWQVASPTVMGGWPAAALMFRKGYIKRGEPVVHEERTMDDLFDLRTPIIAEEAGYDANRDEGSVSPNPNVKGGVSPLAFLVGPVEVKYGGNPAKTRALDASKYIDTTRKVVRSVTGEIALDYATGLCTLNAPAAQGATGFFAKAGEVRLSTVTINARNDYATVMVVSMDGKPLADAAKVLVQITTRCRPYNWKETDGVTYRSRDGKETFAGQRIDDTGAEPWNVWKTDLTLSIANARLKKATLLDANGYAVPDATVDARSSGGVLTVIPPGNAMYLVLE